MQMYVLNLEKMASVGEMVIVNSATLLSIENHMILFYTFPLNIQPGKSGCLGMLS